MKKLIYSAAALLIGLVAFHMGSSAQGPLWDKVIVNLPYSVSVGERVLEPGEYSIKQLSSPGGASRVLLIYKDDMKFETSAMTIPTLDNNTPEDTKVMLHHIGSDYYFDKIWIQGKNYGYEFILPDAVKARQRERMEPIGVAARYETVPAESETAVAQETTTSRETETRQQTEVAQAPPPAPPVREQAPVEQPAPAQPAPREEVTSADRSIDQEPPARSMPETSAGWMLTLLGGSLLSGVGLALRRR
jgi:hypothetical protein